MQIVISSIPEASNWLDTLGSSAKMRSLRELGSARRSAGAMSRLIVHAERGDPFLFRQNPDAAVQAALETEAAAQFIWRTTRCGR
jgi:hypothetical protein